MSRFTSTVSCGLLLFLVTASTAWGQAPPHRPTIGERISAFGRGITGSSSDSDQATPAAATEAPANRTAFPQVDGRSLLPNNMFGSRPQSQPNQNATAGRPQSAAATAPRPTGTATAPAVGDRYATRPRAGSASEINGAAANSHNAQSSPSLPGLGGSPLPPITNGDGAINADEPTSDTQSFEQLTPSENHRPTGTASTRPSPSAGSAAGSAARQSPQPRTPMHVDASELRHELAGSFPTSETGSAATKAPNELPAKAAVGDTQSNTTPPDTVYTLPATDGASNSNAMPVAIPEAVQSTRSAYPIREDNATSVAPAVEPIGRPQTPNGFAPAITPIQPNQPIPTQPLAGASPSPSSRRTSAATRPSVQATPAALSDPNALVTNRTPIITSDIRGPKQILVGREATFRVRLQNQGDAPAEGVDVTLRVPSWADVIDTTATSGTVTQSPGEAKGLLKWQLARVEARGSESVDIKLVPRGSRPLELGVTWTLAPVGSRAVVEVQEPKIEMNVAGPDEVMFGKPQLYRFTISNPGTGIAEGVKIELYPPGGGDKPAASNPLADLPPGKSQTIEVELVAREAGKLRIKAVAAAAGDLTSEAIKEVFCRKPELAVDWRGPEMKYAGTEATYFVRVRNPGTAPAEDVTVRATLPEGAQLVSASEGQVFDAAHHEVAWRVGSLGPGDDSYMELKCTVNTPGVNQLKLEAATASGDLADKKLVETKVVALGDLKLDVTDPSGPVAVGDAAIYEIRVQNRGASAAKDINIVGLFSAGVEPEQGDGSQYTVSNGRVSFRTIDELPAGRQVTLKIRAHAVQPGTHVFRAEVLCRELEIKLAAEETTRFYTDDMNDQEQRQAASGGNGFGTTR